MSYENPVFDPKRDFVQEYLQQFGKQFKIPTTKVVKGCFHPTLGDHIITLNEIIPISTEKKRDSEKDIILVPEHSITDFSNKMEYFYDEAEKDVAKRRQHFMDGLKARGMDEIFEISSTLPVDPQTSIFEDSQESYEGGKAEKKPKNKKKKLKDIIHKKLPKVKGEYARIKSHVAIKKQKKEQISKYKVFNKACDLMLEESNVLFDYQDYDESLKPNEPNVLNPDLYIDHDLNSPRLDEYFPPVDYYPYPPDSHMMNFRRLPDHNGLKYTPPLFREKYELCIWRIDTHNPVKIKNRYFTPEILEAEPNRDFKFDVEIALDNQTLLLVESNNDSNNCMVLIFDLYTLDKV